VDDYVIRFSAVSPEPLAGRAARRLAEALAATPGLGPVVDGACVQDDQARRVTGGFLIRGSRMADAARFGSRLAKEALASAGMPEARLVEMTVTLQEP
jgi:hypothetical protein